MGWTYTLSTTSDETRLEALESYVKDRLGLTYEQLASRVESVDDHKGDLTVTWRIAPTGHERQVFEMGWERQNEYTVKHVVPDSPSA